MSISLPVSLSRPLFGSLPLSWTSRCLRAAVVKLQSGPFSLVKRTAVPGGTLAAASGAMQQGLPQGRVAGCLDGLAASASRGTAGSPGLGRWALIGLCVWLAGCNTLPLPPEDVKQGDYASITPYLAQRIRYEMKKREVVGLSVALVDDQKVVWAEGFGFSDLAQKKPATAETVYRSGSISKLLTATLAMQQVEAGRLALDTPITQYLPDFSVRSRFKNAPPITPRNLMTHHAGLARDYLPGMWAAHPEPFAKLLGPLKDEYVLYPPDHVFSYSNLGVTVMGMALQAVTQQDFVTLAWQSLLQPLGMKTAYFAQDIDSHRGSKAYQDGKEIASVPLRDIPAGGLNASVLDLARFMQMVFAEGRSPAGGQILQPASVREMLRPQNTAVEMDEGGVQVGLGWHVDRRFAGGELSAEHGGSTGTHNGMLRILPEQKLGVVVLANSEGAEELEHAVADEVLALAMAVKTGERQSYGVVPAKRSSRTLTEAQKDTYEGWYAGVFGLAQIRREGGGLASRVMGRDFELIPREDGAMALEYELFGFYNVGAETLDKFGLLAKRLGGHDLLMAISPTGGGSIVGTKVSPTPIHPAWRARLGHHEVDPMPPGDIGVLSEVQLTEENGFLMLHFAMPPFSDEVTSLPLKTLSATEAIILGIGEGLGGTVEAVMGADGVDRLRYAGYSLRRLPASKKAGAP
ncbi:MAG: serine hydrolase domain-containing protein [Lautropia sp.]|nr:serine hydrolase domain-containing protein [Lautropia sp.]